MPRIQNKGRTPEQIEWDNKALEIFKTMEDKDPTKPEIRRVVLRRLGPRPEAPEETHIEGVIVVLEKLRGRGWHKLNCSKEVMNRIWALEYAQVYQRPSGWYEMKITKKGRAFLKSIEEQNKE